MREQPGQAGVRTKGVVKFGADTLTAGPKPEARSLKPEARKPISACRADKGGVLPAGSVPETVLRCPMGTTAGRRQSARCRAAAGGSGIVGVERRPGL